MITLGLRMSKIPFLRVSILTIFGGRMPLPTMAKSQKGGQWSISQTPFSKILHPPQFIHSPLLRESSKKARFSAKEP